MSSRDSIVVDRKEAGCWVIHVYFKEELVVLESCPETPFFPQNINELEDRHEETGRKLVVHNIFLEEWLLHKL